MTTKTINNIWLKASILGCLWASSEIVLGSFLHNLRIPFTGNILTSIGIILMVSVGQVWRERGLFWRAGLVCALMKSISPSAIIFGPMIAIFTESLIMEASTVLFRKRAVSFLIGSSLAMLWNLAQLLIGYVITYGSNIIFLYEKLAKYFQHQLDISSNNYWWPVFIIAVFYLLAGFAAGSIGLYVGRKSGNLSKTDAKSINVDTTEFIHRKDNKAEGSFSLLLLFCNLALIITALSIFNFKNILYSAIAVFVVVTFWIIKYPNVLRPLKKPGFWIFLLVTTSLSALLFSGFDTNNYQGWIIGAEMNLRAVLLILGFAVIGRELRNPIISKWLFSAGFKQLPTALELAFESLPAVITYMPSWKQITRKPISSFNIYVQIADEQLKAQELRINNRKKIIIITGETGRGKTSFLEKIIPMLKQSGFSVYGFIARACFDNEIKSGYILEDINSGVKINLIKTEDFNGAIKFRKYYFSADGIAQGNAIIESASTFYSNSILVIDEIGPMELKGLGWSESLNKLTALQQYQTIWVVRKQILEDVINQWNLTDPVVIDISETSPETANEKISNYFT